MALPVLWPFLCFMRLLPTLRLYHVSSRSLTLGRLCSGTCRNRCNGAPPCTTSVLGARRGPSNVASVAQSASSEQPLLWSSSAMAALSCS